jgi:GWxTD domain-containing protein
MTFMAGLLNNGGAKMNYVIKIIGGFLILVSSVFAQVENSGTFQQKDVQPKFFVDLLNFQSDEDNSTRVDIFVQVPYSEVQFVKVGGNFEAAYAITVTVYNENKERVIVEKSWTENLTTPDFNQTNSSSNFNLSLRSFNLQPGKYVFRTSIEDKDSKREYINENAYTVRNLSRSPAVSDIMLIAKQTNTSSGNKILPNVSRNVTMKRDGLPIFYELYSTYETNVNIQYEVSELNKIIYSDTSSQNIDSGKTQVFYTFKDIDLSLGNYLVNVKINNEHNEPLTTISKSFVSRMVGVPTAIKDLDKAISQLVYIATGSELSYIEDGETQDEKIKRYLEFWKKKDPNPAVEENPIFDEYYRRIAYANENFSHYTEGWKTDRGMVYILLGPPNNVSRHPFEYNSKPYEVWEYYELNKNFVFVDETGFGDYRLITPLYGDFYRYR